MHRLLQKSQSHRVFSSAEIAIDNSTIREFGIPDNAKWICVHSRDSTYLESQFPEVDFSYHSYRDSDINTYRLMAEAMIRWGIMSSGWVPAWLNQWCWEAIALLTMRLVVDGPTSWIYS